MLVVISWVVVVYGLFFFDLFEMLLVGFATHIIPSIDTRNEKSVSIIFDILNPILFVFRRRSSLRIQSFGGWLTWRLRVVQQRCSVVLENLHIINVNFEVITLVIFLRVLLQLTVVIDIHI